jgi:hypothetical protein
MRRQLVARFQPCLGGVQIDVVFMKMLCAMLEDLKCEMMLCEV